MSKHNQEGEVQAGRDQVQVDAEANPKLNLLDVVKCNTVNSMKALGLDGPARGLEALFGTCTIATEAGGSHLDNGKSPFGGGVNDNINNKK